MFQIQSILCPIDLFEPAHDAFHLACSMASHHKARLFVMHVVPPALTYDKTALLVWGEDAGAGQPSLEQRNETLQEKLRQFAAPEPDVRVEYHVLDGDPAETIIAFADKVKADLIVMGTHGQTGLSRLMIGSVVEHVVREAHCPVLTV